MLFNASLLEIVKPLLAIMKPKFFFGTPLDLVMVFIKEIEFEYFSEVQVCNLVKASFYVEWNIFHPGEEQNGESV